jgi:hypothetical protein
MWSVSEHGTPASISTFLILLVDLSATTRGVDTDNGLRTNLLLGTTNSIHQDALAAGGALLGARSASI